MIKIFPKFKPIKSLYPDEPNEKQNCDPFLLKEQEEEIIYKENLLHIKQVLDVIITSPRPQTESAIMQYAISKTQTSSSYSH